MSSPTSKFAICFGEPWQLTLAFGSAFNVFAQFTCRVWHPTEKDQCAWSSTNLEAFEVDEKTKRDFTSDNVKLSLSEDLTTYTFTVSVNPKTVIDVPTQSLNLSLITSYNSNELAQD
jgi:HSP90 family molecular chaperone